MSSSELNSSDFDLHSPLLRG